ncbi:RDD family protein [Empedobacter stercoris]|uniref:RDD family protein n=1 Tax=Empedobacter TaxID=59734 RepID=UPI0021AFDF59|nr:MULTISPECIES: RDD family protein [Empedobacter]MDM1524029.1 RDD family protein [Empedobacter sp. 225-1]MDM1543972.1 RDD family protein [Empedobacter sp. 189-2]UWX65824.1 RDD family protein [Empedobacter stercoris]
MNQEKYILRRVLAALIDYTIIIFITFFYLRNFGELNSEGAYSVSGLKTLPIIIFWFVYFCVFETVLNSTFGNLIVGLKPIDINTKKNVTIKQSFLRHLVDPIDMMFFGLIGIILIKNSETNQRLGDILAKTKVVKS